ncbi:MAG TPA: hypothetical protein VK512_05535 [Xanthobacteraceae bacterium]|jgi:hypothetical protein|nr:hypothetical protein [Xanthobacteraceae bacterium]
MTRLLFTTLLCALGTVQASAQNQVSQQLSELDEDERNAAFTLMLRDSNRKCDQVIRTLFNGTVLGVDEWEALCKDRSSYSISVLAELNETIITSLSCRELLATSKMLLHRAGSKSKAAGCKIK